jgi:N-acetylglucosaminyldiphosphoundecaprenol N-acetyl-beta-D-mannosaminyltransferase
MKEKYADNGANIVGSYSPPFCELEEFDYTGIAKQINDSNADIVWLSLRAPKQDFFAVKLLPHLDKKICIGVGAAFRFSLGQIKHPPKIFKKLGLTGIFWRKINLKQIGWYFHHFFLLMKWGCGILLARLLGKKCND